MPLIVLAPFLAFLMIVSGIRTRRAAANVALAGIAVSLACTLLAAWALFPREAPHTASFQWINIPLAFSGPAEFQGFGIDVSLRADHVALVALAVLLAVALAVHVWGRTGGRAEPGPVRLHALSSLATFAATGAILSGDLGALFGFWGIAGVSTYLLLGQRWGAEGAARSAWKALALPALGDLALLCGIAILYSRYGQLQPDKLYPVLHTVPGWGMKSLTAAAILMAVGAAARAGLFPFHAWMVGQDAPPAVVAWVHGVWPLVAAVVLYRSLPILGAAGPQALAALVGMGAISAGGGAAQALIGNDIRRVAAGAGAAHAGLGFLVMAHGTASAALSGLIAGAPARVALVLAAANLLATMRTADLALMGEAGRRLPLSSAAAGVAGLALVLSYVPAAALGNGPRSTALTAVGLGLLGFCAFRPYLGATLGQLRRRRAFDPERVREVAASMAGPSWLLALGALALAVGGGLGPWLRLLDQRPHAAADPAAFAAFTAPWVAGALAALVVFGARRDSAHRMAAGSEELAARYLRRASQAGERFLLAPVFALVEGLEGLLPRGEAELDRSLRGAGRAPWRHALLLPAVVLAGLAVAVVAGVLGAGTYR